MTFVISVNVMFVPHTSTLILLAVFQVNLH